jgi:hypothetical protein
MCAHVHACAHGLHCSLHMCTGRYAAQLEQYSGASIEEVVMAVRRMSQVCFGGGAAWLLQ